ncbi:signal peptidase II [Barrientosiimonas endolithica]|uniref:signal peptidase II n=1 Tax=Barrientosiimonas endolithica TaxID=1535208 RepID=UPI00259B9415|nr:signal peptidase II [Barrientosiimonas endolithica]
MIAVLIGIAVVTYAIDQLSKAWVVANLQMGEPHPIVGEFFQLRRAANPGAAFSIATNATWLLTIIAIVVIGCTIWAARKLRSRGWAAALGLLIGGALGNLTDRFFRAPGGGKGHVIDMFQLPNWPIFNVADVWIVSAAVLICLLAFRGIGIDGTRVSDDKDKDTDEHATRSEPARTDDAER